MAAGSEAVSSGKRRVPADILQMMQHATATGACAIATAISERADGENASSNRVCISDDADAHRCSGQRSARRRMRGTGMR